MVYYVQHIVLITRVYSDSAGGRPGCQANSIISTSIPLKVLIGGNIKMLVRFTGNAGSLVMISLPESQCIRSSACKEHLLLRRKSRRSVSAVKHAVGVRRIQQNKRRNTPGRHRSRR